MKYLLVLTALFATFSGAFAEADAEAPEEPGPIASLLNATGNWFQTVEIPTIGSGTILQTIDCGDEATLEANKCELLGGVSGVNICRKVAGFDVSLCAPKVFDQYVGSQQDVCGCCDGSCAQRQACLCPCQEGRGVLVEHNIFEIFGRQITWNACYTPSVAQSVMAARPEFGCSAECPEARAAAAATP